MPFAGADETRGAVHSHGGAAEQIRALCPDGYASAPERPRSAAGPAGEPDRNRWLVEFEDDEDALVLVLIAGGYGE